MSPIRLERRHLYGPRKEWLAIRGRILERAGNRCEGSARYPDCRAINHDPHPETGSRVVLTIAHLDHDETNHAETNLRAWCQRCHLTYDAAHHAKNAAQTRRAKRNTLEMFTEASR
jgi:hypothetical protein